ncbi:MAG: AI-2E family transporter, partial [Desulfobacterales bacterium]
VASPLVAIVNILHDELFRKRFLPTVTDADLNNMARPRNGAPLCPRRRHAGGHFQWCHAGRDCPTPAESARRRHRAGVQPLEGNAIQPFVMARGMRLHPVTVIFSMLLCVAAFGVLGVLVASPLVAIVNILHDELFRKRFLPTATDAHLDNMPRKALRENLADSK